MPTRFFKLPLTVQLIVIKKLNYNAVFNLSLCSQRVYGIIQKVNFSKVKRIKYVLHPYRLDVLVEDIDQKQEYMATVARIDINLGKEIATQLGSMKSNFYFEKCYRGLNWYQVLSYNEISAQVCHENLVEHISGIIDDPPRIFLEVDGQDNWNPSLFIEGVNEIALKPDNINANFFEYVKFFPNLECLIIKGELKTAPMFRYIPNMFVSKSGNFARSIMQNFTGERLILYRAECDNQCVLNFLQKWINGNVEADYVFVKSRDKRHIFNPEALLAAIETKKWNPKLRKGKYTFNLGYGPCWKKSQDIKTEQYRDIRRKKDGKIASFLITSKFFTFHSWVDSINFIEFPDLVQKEIIEHLTYNEVFNLSLCSQRVLQKVQRVKFNKIAGTTYLLKPNQLVVIIQEMDRTRHTMATLEITDRLLRKRRALNLGSIKKNFEFIGYKRNLYTYYSLAHNNISEELYQNSLIEHINGIIKNPQRIRLDVKISNPTLFIEGVKELILEPERKIVDAHIFEYVKKFPNIEFLHIRSSMSNAPLFPKIPNLTCCQAGNLANYILQNFTGRRLTLKKAECSNEYVLEFLRKWIAGDLEVEDVRIHTKDREHIFNRAALLAEIETEEWDPEVRPGKFSYHSRYGAPWKKMDEINAEAFLDIKRKTDGRLASFHIDWRCFYFHVWDRLN